MLDVISIGDCTIDVFLNVAEGSVQCSVKEDKCTICFNYGDKVPVKEVIQIPGTGNASNFAIGSSRLGLKSGIITIVGNEGSGEMILENFKKEKVNTHYLEYDRRSPTNYSAIINFAGERTIFSHHEDRKYKFPKINKNDIPKWIYLTSTGHGYEKLYQKTIEFCQKHNVKLGFNPGTLQVRGGLAKIRSVIRHSNVMIVNKDEAKMILGIKEPRDIKHLLKSIHNHGPEIVVITDGEKGAYSHDGVSFIHADILGSKVVERTGAGDAFSTGFISAIIHGANCCEALQWGTLNSDSVIQYIGPQKGLLTLSQMRQRVKKYPIKLTEF